MNKFLVKFVSQKEHGEMLLDGKLFMRPASYYHDMEIGQGDKREGWIFPHAQIYKNANLPIYCMYVVPEKDLLNDKLTITNKCIIDFKCTDGYAVIIKYDEFLKRLSELETGGYAYSYGTVDYDIPQISDFAIYANSKEYHNLFIKHPYFAYQNEFRIVIGKSVYKYSDINKPDHVVYCFSKAIKDIGIVVRVKDYLNETGDFELPLKAVIIDDRCS